MKVDVYSFRFSAILLTGICSAIREELRRKLAALEPIADVAIAAANHKGSKEILQLKPNLWGVGVDLRALWSRLKEMR